MTENTVTQERVTSRIIEKKVETLDLFGKPITQVSVKLNNGFTIVESTTSVDPANYSEKIGEQICMDRILRKIWLLEGYLLQEKLSGELNYDGETLLDQLREVVYSWAGKDLTFCEVIGCLDMIKVEVYETAASNSEEC